MPGIRSAFACPVFLSVHTVSSCAHVAPFAEQISEDSTKGSKATLVYGQMNEPPGARARVALTGLTIAEVGFCRCACVPVACWWCSCS